MLIRLLLLSILIPCISYGQHSCKQGKMMRSFTKSSAEDNMRSDTIDVLNYHIDLEITNFSGRKIEGVCAIKFTPKMNNVGTINLDLLGMTIDSVIQNGAKLSYQYQSPLLKVSLDGQYNTIDTTEIQIFYNGQVYPEAAGFGGFHFQGGYAYSIGVGFQTSPHNYGRSWFPCFDNFKERSTYSFDIKTPNGMVATCNGELLERGSTSSGLIYNRWELKEEIPTYLACVAVSDYKTLSSTHDGIKGDILIELYAQAKDTNAVKNGFSKLGSAIDAYEKAFGPYQWNKVGYSMVPLGGGAMEHATNIAFPISGIGNETLMAHELAHSWWGNLATCHQAKEMWINEGMATYSEAIFLEHEYGREAYEEEIELIHREVVRYPHHVEDGYWALDSVPEQYTYGSHVYRKGASIAHSLRGYLGDELFFSGLSEFLANHKFDDVSSQEMMTELSVITGVDLTDFFQDWVMKPGFAQFETRSFTVTPTAGNYDVNLVIGQKIKGSPSYYNNVPLDVTFMDANWNQHTERIVMSGKEMSFDFNIPVNPVYATVDFNNLISDAITEDKLVIKGNTFKQLKNSSLSIIVRNVVDSAFVRIEHMWMAPDSIKDENSKIQISNSRYIRIDGVIPESFDATLRLNYDARESSGGDIGWLDNDLLGETMDTLKLLYRKSTLEDWKEFPYYQPALIGPQRLFGVMLVDSVLAGEYTLGKVKTDPNGINDISRNSDDGLIVYPNPNGGSFYINVDRVAKQPELLRIYNTSGQLVHTVVVPQGGKTHEVKTELKSGVYFLQVDGFESKKLFIE